MKKFKSTQELHMEVLAAKYFNRRVFKFTKRVKWWVKGFIAFRELQRRKKINWIV